MSDIENEKTVEARSAVLSLLIKWLLPVSVMAIQVYLIIKHIPWRDEWQAYLIAKDSVSLSDLFHNLRYEGHPGLWHALLWAGSIFSTSIYLLTVVEIIVAISTQSILWFFSPFPYLLKFFISTGYFVFFEYGVIARSYSLGVLIFFCFLAFRKSRAAWLLLALLANISMHFAVLSVTGVLILLWVDKRYSVQGIAVWLVGCALALLTMYPAADFQPAIIQSGGLWPRLMKSVQLSSLAFIPSSLTGIPYAWGFSLAPMPWLRIYSLALPIVSLFVLRKDKKLQAIFLMLYSMIIFISVFVYMGYTRHFGVIYLGVVGLSWVAVERQKITSTVFMLWMSLVALSGFWMSCYAYKIPFTPMKALTNRVSKEHLEEKTWVAYPAWHSIDFSVYMNKPVYSLQKQCFDTWQRWNYLAVPVLPRHQLANRLRRVVAASGGEVYLVGFIPWAQQLDNQLHITQIGFYSGILEGIQLYRITGVAGDVKELPLCQ